MVLCKRFKMGLRNSLVAKKYAKLPTRTMSDFDRLRLKYDRNAKISARFPAKSYNYPSRGLDKKVNPTYRTSY